jgi:hypothetical protein
MTGLVEHFVNAFRRAIALGIEITDRKVKVDRRFK